jgi:tRNA-specific adenosine deaminase 3
MARRVAKESGCTGVGVDVGAVIVERLESTKRPRIVAVAGDARHSGLIQNAQEPQNKAPHQECAGNVMGHAALRAIAIVAQKRRILAQLSDSAVPHEENGILDSTLLQSEPESFASRPLSDTENQYLTAADNLLPSGYLCLDLEIYLTHEPCVMCAMAILHSRFNRVVFEKQMPKTGALSAEGDSLGHGLFWRDQLNWKFLVWQWKPFSEDNTEDDFSELDLHA